MLLSLVNCPYCRKQSTAQHVFVDIPSRTQNPGPLDAMVIVKGRDRNKTGLGKFLDEPCDNFVAANNW